MSVSVMHMSDLHLDSKIAGLDQSRRQIRRQELKSSFARACALAVQRGVQLVLISGDVFDGDAVTRDTVSFVRSELVKLAPARVFVAPGNHDPYTGTAWRALRESLPSHVTVFEEGLSCVELPELGARVYGTGFASEFVNNPVLRDFHIKDDDAINLMVLHGQLCAQGAASDYNPVYQSDIAASGLDYLALGHTHAFEGISRAGETSYAYAGTHEGHGFDECGDKGVLLGTVDKGSAQLEFVPTCIRRYHRLELDLTDCATAGDMAERVCAAAGEKDDLYRIYLDGTVESPVPAAALENAVDAFWCEGIDRTRMKYDLDGLAQDYTLKGIFARNVLSALDGADGQERENLQAACETVLRIFDKGGAL